MASGTIWLDSTRESLEGRINWSSSSLGSERNASTVYAELQMRRNDGYTTTGTWNGHLEIGGDDRDFSWYGGISSDWVTVISFSIEKNHNSNGTGDCYIGGTGYGPSGTSMSGHYVWGDETVTLDTIPRYVTGTSLRVLSYDLNKVEVKWYADQLCSNIKYGTSSGNMREISVNTNSSTFIISGLNPNTEYTIYFNAKRKDSGLYLPQNITIKMTTADKAKFTSVPNVNIGETQTIQWNNPSGSTLTLKLYQTDGETEITDFGEITGTSKDILTDATTIYNLTPYSNTYTAKYILTTICNNVEYTDEKEFDFIVTNANPYYYDPSPVVGGGNYEDTNDDIYDLTHNRHKIVKGFSNIKISVKPSAYHAQKGANLTENGASFIVVMDGERQEKQYANAQYFTFEQVQSITANLYVKDSRGNILDAGNVIQQPSNPLAGPYFLDYFTPIIQGISVLRTNRVSEETTLLFSGIFWNKSFGYVTNTIKSLKYKYKEVTASASSFVEKTLNVSSLSITNNNISGTYVIDGDLGPTGFNVSNAYDIVLMIEDELGTHELATVLAAGTPGLAIVGGNKIAQGRKYDTNLGGDFQMNGTVYLNGESLMTQGDIEDSLTSTSTTKALSANQGKQLKDMFDNYVPEIITAYINRKNITQSQPWTPVNLAPFNTSLKTTNRITVTNTGLKIGSGVSKILISAHCRGINHAAFSGDKVFSIYQNGTGVTTASLESYMTNLQNWCAQTVSPALISCQENDIFSIYMSGRGTGTGEVLGGYLTIQIVE